MEMNILRAETQFTKCLCCDNKTKISINNKIVNKKFKDLENGDYALIKIDSLIDKIAVEEFIEKLKNK